MARMWPYTVCTLVWLPFATACERRDAPPLAPPVQISPASGSVFDSFPRTTTLVWTSVARARSYTVEVDTWCPDQSTWCSDVGATNLVRLEAGIDDTTFTHEHVGAQAGRWRVWAVTRDGRTSARTGWWRFEYTR